MMGRKYHVAWAWLARVGLTCVILAGLAVVGMVRWLAVSQRAFYAHL
jgi:hypothetical protein